LDSQEAGRYDQQRRTTEQGPAMTEQRRRHIVARNEGGEDAGELAPNFKPVPRHREAKGERDRDPVRVGLRPGARSVDDPETGRRAGAERQGADHQGVVVDQHPGGEGVARTGKDHRGEHG
jgi:hypothetical protein